MRKHVEAVARPLRTCRFDMECRAVGWLVRLSDQTANTFISDAGIDKVSHTPVRPASEKRQGTKSREVGHRRCRELYGDLGTGKGIGIAHHRDRRGWRGMPSEWIATDGWRERGARCSIGLLLGVWKAVIERELPLRARNQRQGRTE